MNNLKKTILSKIIDNGEPFTEDDMAYFELMYKKNINSIIKSLEKEKYIEMVYYNEIEHVCTSKNDRDAIVAYIPKISFNLCF